MDRGQYYIPVIKSWSGWNPTIVCKLNICLGAEWEWWGHGWELGWGWEGSLAHTSWYTLCKEPSVDREACHLCTCCLSRLQRWFPELWMGDSLERMVSRLAKLAQSTLLWAVELLLNEPFLDEDPDFSELRENKGNRQRRTLLKGICRPPRNMEYCKGIPALHLSPFLYIVVSLLLNVKECSKRGMQISEACASVCPGTGDASAPLCFRLHPVLVT